MYSTDKTIVHLSDLHLSKKDHNPTFEILEQDIKDQNPNLIIVSGDLVNNPSEDDLIYTRDKLFGICEKCGFQIDTNGEIPSCKELITVPGNHDVKLLGNFGWKYKLFKKKEVNKINKKKYYQIFGKLRREYISEHNLSIFSFDSNTKDYELTFARGRIANREFGEEDQYAAIQKCCSENYNKDGFHSSIKIAVLHHHPVAIADTEYLYRYQNVFLELEDSGTFLREIAKRGFDIILHGHKHYPQFIKYYYPKYSKEVAIISAGSACKKQRNKSPNRSYNVINSTFGIGFKRSPNCSLTSQHTAERFP